LFAEFFTLPASRNLFLVGVPKIWAQCALNLYGAKKMNMISTGAFLTEMDASKKQTSPVEKFAAVWEKKNAKAARAGGVSLMALSLAACGGSSSTTDTTTDSSTDSSTDTTTVDAQSLTLTAAGDNAVGGAGDDTFSGMLVGASGTGTTVQGGDVVTGGAGDDAFTIFVSGSGGGAYELGGVVVSGVETIGVSNFDSHANDTTVDMSTMSGVTDIKLTNSSATGDTVFTSVQNIVDAHVKGAGDATVTYAASVVSGTADVQNVTVDTYTGKFTVGNVETLNITASGGNSTLTDISATAATAVTISGDKNITITADVATGLAAAKSIDASAATGKVNITSSDTTLGTFLGGSGDDTLVRNIQNSDTGATDKFDAGEGVDTLSVTTGANVTAVNMANYSNFERLTITDGGANTIDLDGITQFNIIRNADDTDSNDTTINNVSAGTNFEITVGDAGSEETTVDLATDTASDETTVTLGGTTTGVDVIFQGDDYETINVVSKGAANLIDIDSSDLTTLNASGAKALTLSSGTASSSLATIDASAMTAAFTMEAAEGTAKISITTGSGNDTVYGGSSHNTISTGAGNDTVIGLAGNNTITLGAGNDTVQFSTFSELDSSDTIAGGDGTDKLQFTADASADFTSSTTLLSGVSGFEKYSMSGMAGSDTMTINDAIMNNSAVTIDFTSGVSGANILDATAVLSTSNVVNFTDNGTGTTTYKVGNGIDNISLKAGNDTVDVSTSLYLSSADSYDMGAGTGDKIQINIDGGSTSATIVKIGDDQLSGLSNAEVINIDDATATYIGITLTDTIVGNNSNADALTVAATDGSTVFNGLATIDASAVTNTAVLTLTGGSGNDTILAGAGATEIDGADGADTITLGSGKDDYHVSAIATTNVTDTDTVTGFNWGTSSTAVDQIQVNATYLGNAKGADTAGELDNTVDSVDTITGASGASGVDANTDVAIFTGTTHSVATLDTAVETLAANTVTQDFFAIYQSALGGVRVAIVESDGIENSGADFTVTEIANFSDLSISDVASLIDATDFIVA